MRYIGRNDTHGFKENVRAGMLMGAADIADGLVALLTLGQYGGYFGVIAAQKIMLRRIDTSKLY